MTVVLPYVWGLFWWFVFLLFQAQGISGGDSGDLATAAYLGGVPHPPGYPLYTLIGFLVSHIPVSSVAWRMGLLSSLPHAITVSLVFLLVRRLTGRVASGVFASLVLVGNYLFFLYSVTPEVFALLDLFLIVLTFLFYQWITTKKPGYLLWTSFVFGLSLSHHHVILFFVPALAFWVWQEMRRMRKIFVLCAVYFTLGLLPYLYIPIAARGNAIINWDRAVDLPNFIRLVSRADYGSFVSSGFYGSQLVDRIIQVKTYLQFLVLDFRWFGIALALCGLYWAWVKKRSIAGGLALAVLFLGPLFYFYASFPLVNRFTIGTYERFLLPSYLFIALLMGFGFEQVILWSKQVLRLRMWRSSTVQFAFVAILFMYPISALGVTLWRFWGLRTDQTAQYLARDILASVPEDAILLMARDTQLFTTQYVRYSLGERPDVKLIHGSRMPSSDYPDVIARVFPHLTVPTERGEAFLTEFIHANSGRFTIVSNTRLPTPPGWLWVPHGLVFWLTEESRVPSVDELITGNDALWSSYQNPENGILGRYNHLMLADVRGVYATGRIELGKTLMRAGKLPEAKRQFEAALTLGSDTERPDGFTYLGLTELFLKHCDGALSAFENAREVSATEMPELTLYESQTYRDCVGDKARADELFSEYERQKKSLETPLIPKQQ